MAVASRFCTLGFGARNNSRRTRRRCVRLCTRDGTPCPGLLRRAGLWRKMRRSLPPLCKSLLGKMVRRTGQTFWTPSFPKGLPRRRRFRERSRSSCRSSPPSQRHEQEPLCAQDAQEATDFSIDGGAKPLDITREIQPEQVGEADFTENRYRVWIFFCCWKTNMFQKSGEGCFNFNFRFKTMEPSDSCQVGCV